MCRRWHKQTIQARTGLAAKEQHGAGVAADPETLLLNADTAVLLDQALTDMPARFRELLVLRELEGLSYQELADVMEIPLGTVMSRLFRARQAFRMELEAQLKRIDAQWSARTRKRDSHPSFDNPEGLAG
jgi:RNA polymerase sigma factor (sigma-70 family)